MAIPMLEHIFSFKTLNFIPKSRLFSSSSASPPSYDQSELITNVAAILIHQRSKCRWSSLLSLYPSGFTPSQFSQIALHIRNNAHLSLRFFLFTKQKSLCNHDLSSYSTIIHILARARLKTRAMELIKLAMLAPGINSCDQQSRHLKLFESLARSYRDCRSAPFVFDLLVKCCLNMKKIDASIEIVRRLMCKGIIPQVNTCNALIWSVSKSRGAYAGYEMFVEIFETKMVRVDREVKRAEPNLHTFNALMACFYSEGLLGKVEEIWREMRRVGCAANAYSYSVLMAAFWEDGESVEAERLWEEMRIQRLEPDVVAYNTMIGGLCKVGQVARAEEFFKEMGLTGVQSTPLTYEHLINGYCKVSDVDSAIFLYRDMHGRDFQAGASTIEALIGGLCDENRGIEALGIMKLAMREPGFCPTVRSYGIIVKSLCRQGRMEEALNLQAEMVGKGSEPNLEIYDAFIGGYLQKGNEKMAEALRKELLETMEKQLPE